MVAASYAAVVERVGVVGVNSNRLGVVGDRPLQVTLVAASNAAVVERDGVFGVESNRLGVVGDRPLQVTLDVASLPAVVERDGVFGVGHHGCVILASTLSYGCRAPSCLQAFLTRDRLS